MNTHKVYFVRTASKKQVFSTESENYIDEKNFFTTKHNYINMKFTL